MDPIERTLLLLSLLFIFFTKSKWWRYNFSSKFYDIFYLSKSLLIKRSLPSKFEPLATQIRFWSIKYFFIMYLSSFQLNQRSLPMSRCTYDWILQTQVIMNALLGEKRIQNGKFREHKKRNLVALVRSPFFQVLSPKSSTTNALLLEEKKYIGFDLWILKPTRISSLFKNIKYIILSILFNYKIITT